MSGDPLDVQRGDLRMIHVQNIRIGRLEIGIRERPYLRGIRTGGGFVPARLQPAQQHPQPRHASGQGPIASSERLSGATPSREIRPWLDFIPATPQSAAGMRTEPPVSDPTARGTTPPATATADPLDEPPGEAWPLTAGLTGVPRP